MMHWSNIKILFLLGGQVWLIQKKKNTVREALDLEGRCKNGAYPHTRGIPVHDAYGYGVATGLQITHRTTPLTRGVVYTRATP
jgi:hypothetical protein